MSKLKLILSLLTKREKRQLIFVFFAILILGFMELVGIGSIAPFMSVVTNPDLIESNGYLNWAYQQFHFISHTDFIVSFGFWVIVLLALSNIVRTGVTFLINVYSGQRQHSIAIRLMKRYLGQPYLFFLNANSADMAKKILSDIHQYVIGVLSSSLTFLANFVVALFIVVLLFVMNPLIALIVSLTLCTSYILIFLMVQRYMGRKGKEQVKANFLKYKYVSEAFGGIKDLKLLGREDVFLQLFSRVSKQYAMNDAYQNVVRDIPKYLLETIAFGGILGMIIIMIKSGNQVDTFLPLVTVYAFGGYRLLPALQRIFSLLSSIRYSFSIVKALSQDYREMVDPLVVNREVSGEIFSPPGGEICLNNINFRYPNTQADVVRIQSLKIRANTSVGFVGATGCGKTTIIDIILGLLEPQRGSILVDGVEINKKNIRNWQSHIGYVPQSIFLVDDTIGKNIAFGISDEQVDQDAIVRAANVANIHDFIRDNLEKGYDTLVGERGIRLSGGQRQRIGIARAVYHNPAVLILDEATSALDGLTENAIMDAIHNLSHKKTIIMIAHRLSTVRECDEIFIMDGGAILARGSYEELLDKNEIFRKMSGEKK